MRHLTIKIKYINLLTDITKITKQSSILIETVHEFANSFIESKCIAQCIFVLRCSRQSEKHP